VKGPDFSRLKPAGLFGRALARVLPRPEHDPLPARRTAARRLTRIALDDLLAPLSLAGRLVRRHRGGSPTLDPSRIKSIAFIRLDHIGDAILSSPQLRALKARFPSAKLVVYARPSSAEYLVRLPYVDAVELADVPWIRPDSSPVSGLRACMTLAREIGDHSFDLAVDLRYHNRLDSLLLSLCGARHRLGFDAGGLGFGLTHPAAWPTAGHETERCAAALVRYGIPVTDPVPDFPVSHDEARASERLVGRGIRFAAIHPGAGNAIKRWMPERFAFVARELVRRAGVRIVLLSGPGEDGCGEETKRAVPGRSLIDLRGRLRLPELGALMGRASLFLGNDGGAAHIAAAAGTPALVLFSGTNMSSQWAPIGRRVRIIEKTVPCKPCAATDCPYSQACLRAITADEVLATALDMLSKKGRPGPAKPGSRGAG
jgi:heptosyltransferase-2